MCICHPHYGKIGEAPPFEWSTTPIVPEPDRPPTIDPDDVKVGDVVEVEASDGSWLVRGEVTGIYPQHGDEYRIFLLDLDGHQAPVAAKHATVRLVSRVEPEPDPEQVEAIRDTYGHVLRMNLAPEEAAALHRLGVRVLEAQPDTEGAS